MIPVHLEYTAPEGCPTHAQFAAAVADRGGDFARPGRNAAARVMVVTLRRAGREHTGALQLRFDDGASDPRHVQAETCAEVAEALTVVAAIALRGEDSDGAGEAASPSSEKPGPTSAPIAAAPPIATPLPRKSTRLVTAGDWGVEKIPVTAGDLAIDHSWSASVTAGAAFGVVPGVVLPRYDLNLMRTNFVTTPNDLSYLVGGVFGVRWSFLGKGIKRVDGHETELSGFKAGVNACASVTYDTQGFVLLFCPGFTVGMMHLNTAAGDGSYEQVKDVGLGVASLELASRYHLGRHFHLNLDAGGEFWASQLTAERADGRQLFRSNLFSGYAQLGVGLSF